MLAVTPIKRNTSNGLQAVVVIFALFVICESILRYVLFVKISILDYYFWVKLCVVDLAFYLGQPGEATTLLNDSTLGTSCLEKDLRQLGLTLNQPSMQVNRTSFKSNIISMHIIVLDFIVLD